MIYKTKSVLIGRKKRQDKEDFNHRPCYISLFDKNNPHLCKDGPKQTIEFDKKHKVVIEGLNIHYLLPGNDLVINDLKELEVNEEGEIVKVTGKHE
ncbi:MAG: hypothetical protein ABIJ18_00575 [archaeon]